MKITAIDMQKQFQVNVAVVRALGESFASQAGLESSEGGCSDVSIAVTDDAGIADLHLRFMGDAEPTDVMTFESVPVPGQQSRSGNVTVNVQRAMQVGHRHGGADRELALYVAHGIDHLTGADDATGAGQRSMRRRELEWLRKAERAGLLAGLLPGGATEGNRSGK